MASRAHEMLAGFESATVDVGETALFVRKAGNGQPLLLLHGFPETHLMWRDLAPVLAKQFTVICADLRGYGRSGCPVSAPDHAPYSKRAMADDMVRLMAKFGFSDFMVAGHDPGGRVAYRMAIDHPAKILKLAVLDIVPTAAVWDRADARLTLGFWPWCLLAQPAPLPETLISAAPQAVIEDAIHQWGSSAQAFPDPVKAAYVEALSDDAHVHAICEEYRAAASVDRQHDTADVKAGRRISCPVLVLWSAEGALATWYTSEGGPLALWKPWCDYLQGQAMEGGHFFPEERPSETAAALKTFFAGPV